MRDLREILRQKLCWGEATDRRTSCGDQPGQRRERGDASTAAFSGLGCIEELDDEALETRMYGPRGAKRAGRPEPDLPHIHLELRRTGVTLQLLHLEYLEQCPDGYRDTVFCERYKQWLSKQRLSLRQTDLAGDKMFVDYSARSRASSTPVRERCSK